MDKHAHALVIQTDTVEARLELARELFESGEASVILEHRPSLRRAGTRLGQFCG
jgi:hypothetical protein